ncbi:MAPEG family protein [Nocardioides sp.]|uniref:MAPEG family protein n=1 Tax=Nocardioides sp. TaxID=35761 RepID=UPI0031FE595C|nr:rane-associated protein in eicosanoid and glutathione metabolism [Nocardioides sp.]
MNTIPVLSIALMGIMLFLLGANVTRHRAIRGDTGNQMPSDPADRMYIAQRAHGNAAEYVPTLAVLIVVCSTLTDSWWLDTLAVAALVSRVLHAVGMLSSRTLAGHGPVRDIGAMGTYLSGVALAVTALVTM